VADDLGPELGCYGYEGVATPNLDRLAAEGTLFTRAFTTSPVCSASRTAIITGMYQTSIGGFHHRTRNLEPLPEPVRPGMAYFREAGYFVSNGSMRGEPLARPGKTDYNFEFDRETAFDGTDWRERAEGQRFFAQVQIHEPHRKFVVTGRSGEGLEIPPFYPDHAVIRADWANYLATIEVLDRKVGIVLDRLREDGLADETIVFFFGDHGRPHLRGKQWLYDGGLHIPLLVRIPGRGAGQVEDRLVSSLDFLPTSLALAGINPPEHFVGRNWFAPGYEPPEYLFAARDRCGDAPDRIRSVRSERWKYIRNFEPERSYSQLSSYKKLSYPARTVMKVMLNQGRLQGRRAQWFADTRPGEELYDLQADPGELNNLAKDPAHAERVEMMRAELGRWIEETGDQGARPEGDEEYLEALLAEKHAWYARVMKRRGLEPDLSDREYLEWWKGELGVAEKTGN